MAQLDNSRVTEEPEAAERAPDLELLQFPELLIVLAKRKFFILQFVAAATILALLVSFLLPNTYTAVAKIMPPQQNQSMASTAILSQMGPLALLAGQGLGLRSPSDLYIGMLHSRTIADDLIDRFSLTSVYRAWFNWKDKRRVDARNILDDRTRIVAGKDGIISISVDDRDPKRAAVLANAYVEELEKLTKTLAVTEAGKRRAFFERETKMAMDDLAAAEQSLKETQEKTGLYMLDPQSRAMIESVTTVRAQIAAKEVQIQSMRSFATAENPDLTRAEQELAALREQRNRLEMGSGKRSIADVPIENVPAAGLEFVRKLREVKYREAVFELLAKQYEVAKIDEARDALIVQQLDVAIVPEKKSGPLRAVIVLFSAVLALLLAIMAAFFVERLEKAKEDPHFAAQFHLFRFYLRGRQKPAG
jgi:tyrosine-protein kinase Etk/Wzc